MTTGNQAIVQVSGRPIPVPGDDIDTDRIIPARFMKCVTFDGLGEFAFYDERFDETGSSKKHPFDLPEYAGGSILFTGDNFGCGSSREHAPQALLRFGIRAVVAISYADIFANNCVAIGIPAVRVSREISNELIGLAKAHPQEEFSLNIKTPEIKQGNQRWPCTMPEPARNAFLENLWDTTALLLTQEEEIAKVARAIPYMNEFVNKA